MQRVELPDWFGDRDKSPSRKALQLEFALLTYWPPKPKVTGSNPVGDNDLRRRLGSVRVICQRNAPGWLQPSGGSANLPSSQRDASFVFCWEGSPCHIIQNLFSATTVGSGMSRLLGCST